MWKKAFVGATALMIAGSMIVYAQQRPEEPGASAEDKGAFADARVASLHEGLEFNAEDMAAFADARIAALHAGLKLNADQKRSGQPSSKHGVISPRCGWTGLPLRTTSSRPLIRFSGCSARPMP